MGNEGSSGSMKVLTLHQPYASLIALGVKSIETRSWSTKYRGPLAIHAAKSVEYEGETVGEWRWDRGYDGRSILVRRRVVINGLGVEAHHFPLGAIVATCTLVDVVPMVGWRNASNNVGREVCWDGVRWLHPTSNESVAMARRHPRRLAIPDDRGLESQRGEGAVRLVEDQRPYGLFEPGRYAWILADVEHVDPPVPFKGGQGLTKTWKP
jgi:hypothetical protein